MNATFAFGQIFLFVHTKALLEPVYPAAAVHQLLSAGKKRMALGADFHTDVLPGRGGVNLIATCATDGGLLVLWMDALFHRVSSPLSRKNRVATVIIA